MKKSLMHYCQRAYATALACEIYGSEVGYKLGFVDAWKYKKSQELDKYRQTVVFPPNLGIVPVAVFTVGVTWRLVTSVFFSLILRFAMAVRPNANKDAGRDQ